MNKIRSILLLSLSLLTAGFLFAQTEVETLNRNLTAGSAVLMDYQTGRILYERDGNRPIPPASMTKVMTLYLTYDAIRDGRLNKEDVITIDEAGSSFSRPPFSSLMLLEEGQRVSVLDLMKGVAVDSGNDAAYALAEILGPGKREFVNKMNAKARKLGLSSARFADPDGWSEFNIISPRDYAVLARSYIRDYPEALKELHSVPFMVYPLPGNLPEGVDFRIKVPRRKDNTNLLLGRYEGIDGLKTGYIDQSGFNFTGTASRDGRRLIAVLMGIRTESYYQGIRRRAEETEMLLDYGFSRYLPRELKAPSLPEVRVWYSREKSITPVLKNLPEVLLAEDETDSVYSMLHVDENMTAPLKEGTVVGRADYYLGGYLLGSSELCVPADIDKGNFLYILRDRIIQWTAPVREKLFTFIEP